MKELKKLFTNSRLGIGAAIGLSLGYFMDGDPGGYFGAVAFSTLIVVIVENRFFAKK